VGKTGNAPSSSSLA